MRDIATATESSLERLGRHAAWLLLIAVAAFLPLTGNASSQATTASNEAQGASSWGTAPCGGIALDNFEACPEELVGAQTCCGLGVCASTGQFQCNGDQLQDSCVPGEPQSSSDTSCDGVDQDCSGEADEDYSSQNTTCGVGQCSATGQTQCEDGSVTDTCTPGEPETESCNGLDDDCDGSIDEGLGGETTTCGIGACSAEGQLLCQGGEFVDTCEPGEPTTEQCGDGIDNDCDGQVDENC